MINLRHYRKHQQLPSSHQPKRGKLKVTLEQRYVIQIDMNLKMVSIQLKYTCCLVNAPDKVSCLWVYILGARPTNKHISRERDKLALTLFRRGHCHSILGLAPPNFVTFYLFQNENCCSQTVFLAL